MFSQAWSKVKKEDEGGKEVKSWIKPKLKKL